MMIEKGKISALQMAMIMYPVVVATADLMIPAVTAMHAKRDLWMSPIWASIVGFLVVYVVYKLHKLYPKETLIEYSTRIFGRIPGKVIGMVCLFGALHINAAITRQYGEFVSGVFLRKTPILLIIISMVLVCALAVRGGLEVIARCAQLFVPMVMLSWILIIILLIPDMETKNMFPVLAKGIMPSLLGAMFTAGWYSHFVLLTFMLPYLTDPEKGMKWGMISIFVIMLTLMSITLTTLFIFGDITSYLTYPVMMAIKYITAAKFIEHLESIMMAIWVVGTFIKITMYYYAFVLGISQWLNLSDYRPVVFPCGVLLVVFTIWAAPDVQEFNRSLGVATPFANTTLELLIPIILLITASVKQRIQRNKAGA